MGREDFDGDVHAGIAFTPDEELHAYRMMLLIRRFEEKAGQLYALGEIEGTCPLAIGQEAVIVGMEMAARASDAIIAGHRTHGAMLARGTEPHRIMSELLGCAAGLSNGQGGSIHVFDPARRFYGGHDIMGAQAPLGAGLAFAEMYRGADNVAICTLGDGAMAAGVVQETLQLAARLNLPLILVIDNNTTEDGDRFATFASPNALSERGAAFGIPGEQVDGIDVRKVCAAGQRALARARRGGGPTIVEMLTYRYRGHAATPVPARAAGAIRRPEDTDPVAMARARILEHGAGREVDLKAIEKDVKDRVNAAVTSARAAVGAGAQPRTGLRQATG